MGTIRIATRGARARTNRRPPLDSLTAQSADAPRTADARAERHDRDRGPTLTPTPDPRPDATQYAPSPRTTADTVRARSLRSRRSDHVAA